MKSKKIRKAFNKTKMKTKKPLKRYKNLKMTNKICTQTIKIRKK